MNKEIITKKCEICNNHFTQSYKPKKFCSIGCYRKHQKSGNYKIDKLKTGSLVPCTNCSEPFYVAKGRQASQDNHFCNKKCYLEHHSKTAIKVIYNIKVICKKCKKEKTLDSTEIKKYQEGQRVFYCNDNCRSKRERVLKCKVCGCLFCSISYRKANNDKGFIIIRSVRETCSSKCLSDFYKTDVIRKDKISKAFSGSNHPNYVNGVSYNSRVRKTDIKENFGITDKKELFEKFNNKCFKCGNPNSLTIDHHVPFSRGGILTFSNCVLLCKSCNSKKNAKMPKDFYTDKELEKLDKMGISENSLFSKRK